MYVYQFLSFVCIIDTLSGFYLEKYFGGGEASYSAMNISLLQKYTWCRGSGGVCSDFEVSTLVLV